MSKTLLQAFTYGLADYVTEYKLLPTLYNTPRTNSLEPPASPRGKISDETTREFSFDRNTFPARAISIDNPIPTTPITHSRRVSHSQRILSSSKIRNSSEDQSTLFFNLNLAFND